MVKNFLKGWGGTILCMVIAVSAIWLLNAFVFSTVSISGTSMEPNLLNQQRVGVNHLATLKRGDAVVFDARQEDPRFKTGNSPYYVKRIIGIPGDTVEYRSGNLYVNNKKVNQDYISNDEKTQGTEGDFGATWNLKTLSTTGLWQAKDQNKSTVPSGEYFVMGDHRSVSNDGRYFGFVDRNHIMGKVVVPFWYSQQIKNSVDHQDQHFFA
ncbi:signal peptidase I [Convivina intestini]|uniref:signal peptidase I n=1 Tax=Convivina intestini TaxID=1505726 RepID=UPI00200C5D74|nr:signal peptidase I [Convivina intestini]CAH1855134.1 Signal peptidase IB [Convivina intestini]